MPVQYCTTHRDRETLRICGRCERPFCPDCLIATPVGGRCRECAKGPRIARMKVQWWRWPLVVATAMVGGMFGAIAAGMAAFFMLIVCIAAGQFIAAAVLAASGRKAGTALTVVGIAGIAAGGLAAGLWTGFGPYQLVGVALMAGSAYQRLR